MYISRETDMKRNTMSYKVRQYLMFGGVGTALFCAVVVIPFIYGIYLTFTSWDGVSVEKPFVGLSNYTAAFSDTDFWLARGRTVIYSVPCTSCITLITAGPR